MWLVRDLVLKIINLQIVFNGLKVHAFLVLSEISLIKMEFVNKLILTAILIPLWMDFVQAVTLDIVYKMENALFHNHKTVALKSTKRISALNAVKEVI
jgi:hypothetical protein